MKIGITIFGTGRGIPQNVFHPCGDQYGKEVIGEALGWGGSFVQFKPDQNDHVYTLPTNEEWIVIRTL